jgi:TPR repeat protein
LPSPAPATPALQHTPPPPVALPAPPTVATAAPALAALAGPPAPPRQAAPAPRRIEAEQLAALMRRGEALLAVGDVSAARRFFERAAEAGSAPAALALARTYDAGELARLGARGIAPDAAAADRWQARARQLEEQTP